MKVRNFLKIGVVGAGNKGKTFLLQKLADIELPTGTSVKTEGLSIRCPDMESENQNIILLDSAGSETPLLEDSNFEFKNYKDKHKELKEQLDNLARDKSLTENFLQNIIINESNMLLIVVGNLTYQEQKLINKIKEETDNNNQSLYVIHNLQTFVEKSQVEKYINETLLKSATFRLTRNKEIIIKSDNKNEPEKQENDAYYIEEILSENIYPQTIKVCDRSTMLNLMVGLNGYTLCSGIISSRLNGDGFVAIPFHEDEDNPNSIMEIGYVTKRNSILSKMGEEFIAELKCYLEDVRGDLI